MNGDLMPLSANELSFLVLCYKRLFWMIDSSHKQTRMLFQRNLGSIESLI